MMNDLEYNNLLQVVYYFVSKYNSEFSQFT